MDVTAIALLGLGLVLLLVGGSLLVRGASLLAQAAAVSPIVVGLTVVAFGTSAPELATSVAAALRGSGDIAFGNVVGSNIFNVLFILGASAIVAPLVVAQKLVRVDVPILIGLALAVLALGGDGRFSRPEGAGLLAALLAYVVYTVRASPREPAAVRAEYEQAFAAREVRRAGGLAGSLGLVVVGLALLVWGSRWLVAGAVDLARAVGVSELIIGLTIVAAGTSMPEVATSIVAAWKGERDIAVGNVLGSNVFNILGVLGASALLAPGGVPATAAAMRFDVPVMIAASIACLPICLTGHRISRWEGIVLLGYYGAYVAFLILDAANHDRLPTFSWIMLAFVMPLTALTFAVVAARRRAGAPDAA